MTFLATDGDLFGRVGVIDSPRVHVRLRDGSALCGRVGYLHYGEPRHRPSQLCAWCLRAMNPDQRKA